MADETENAVPEEFLAEPKGAVSVAPSRPLTNQPKATIAFDQNGNIDLTKMEEFYRLATMMAEAGFAPKSYLNDPKRYEDGFSVAKITIGMMYAKACGFDPIIGLRNIAVINGMPCVWGDGALAMVRASGLLKHFTENAIVAAADNELPGVRAGECVGYSCFVWRKGDPQGVSTKFTHVDAKRAGLLDKTGPWKDYRPRMYQMRARSFALRDAFPDVFGGLQIAEEVQDYAIEGTATEVSSARQIESKTGVNVASALDAFASKKEAIGVEEKKETNV